MTEQQLIDKVHGMIADVMQHKGYADRVKEELEELKKAKEKETVTLRDQFAMAALQGMLASEKYSGVVDYAELAYKMADAMLKAREE